jgi:hypothetical protein
MNGGQAASHGRDLESLRSDLKCRNPRHLATCTGGRYAEEEGAILITYWDMELKISTTHFTVVNAHSGEGVDEGAETVLIHYLHTADGSDISGSWASLADLPAGSFYRHAYQGYSGDYLASIVQNELEPLRTACQSMGGKAGNYGDISYSFHVLPRLDLLLVYHRGDEEFPPSAQVLFSSNAGHVLPTDLCAYVGRQLVVAVLERQG